MKIPTRFIGLAIGAITGIVSSTLMTFIGLTINYGFQPGFLVLWAKAAVLGYAIGVPLLMLIVPPIQRFVMRHASI
ncbi:MAG: DUF2798 domain-containing protein [Rhodospirillaceae bacterium]|nr:DUF2798 domain-containing protein [Rhodospirillaceae bacterium]